MRKFLGLVTDVQKRQHHAGKSTAWLTHSQVAPMRTDKTLGLPTLEYRRLRADVIQVYKILNQIDRVDIDQFFTMSELSTRGNSLKIISLGHALN